MSPQFPRRATQPLRPDSIRVAVKRGREMLDIIERYHNPQSPREHQQLTRAINGLASHSRQLMLRQSRLRDPDMRPPMAMLPNDYHPSWRCSCRECLQRYQAGDHLA